MEPTGRLTTSVDKKNTLDPHQEPTRQPVGGKACEDVNRADPTEDMFSDANALARGAPSLPRLVAGLPQNTPAVEHVVRQLDDAVVTSMISPNSEEHRCVCTWNLHQNLPETSGALTFFSSSHWTTSSMRSRANSDVPPMSSRFCATGLNTRTSSIGKPLVPPNV